MIRVHHLAMLIAVAVASGCSPNRAIRTDAIQDSAKTAYLQGLDSLESGNYLDAISAFQIVAKSPSYVKWAALARLRIADSLYFQEKHVEAVEQYMAYLNQYQGDPNEAYAQYMIARCWYAQMPDDWFLTPPAYEKDLASVQRAREKLEAFVRLYGRSRFLADARRMLDEVRGLQFAHSDFVARFYEDRDKPAGAVVRLEHMRAQFPDLFDTEENWMRLGLGYVQSGKAPKALDAYQTYLERYPDGVYASTARESVERLRGMVKTPEVTPELAPPPPSGDVPEPEAGEQADEPADDGAEP